MSPFWIVAITIVSSVIAWKEGANSQYAYDTVRASRGLPPKPYTYGIPLDATAP